jgi:glycosyltransferase involved in cell wall biosynthesis
MSPLDRILIFNSAPMIGGAEIHTEQIIHGLHKKFRLSILASRRFLGRINIPVQKYPILRLPAKILLRRGGYWLESIYFRFRPQYLLNGRDADLVHFQVYERRLINLLAPDLTRRAIPHLITIHTEFGDRQYPDRRSRPRDVLAPFSAIVCVCNATKRNLVSLGIPPEKCRVIHNGVDCEGFTPNRSPGRFITWVGRISESDKNPMLFVRIAELARQRGLPLRFRMIGDGPALPLIRKYVVEHNVQNLQLDGWIQDARQIYRDAQILCITSTTEGLPLVLLESMASGVPVVASNVGGIPELIKDDSVGSLVATFTEVDFLNAIVSLCQDAERYSAVSRNARNWVKEGFSLNRMLDQLAGLYEELLKTRSGSGNEMISTSEAVSIQTY